MRKIYLFIASATCFLQLQATDVFVSLPDTAVAHPSGTIIEIPVFVSNLTGLNIEAYQFILEFNNSVIVPEYPYYINSGTVSAAPGWSVMANHTISNKLIVGAIGYTALTGSGILLKLKFRILVDEGSCSLTFSPFLFNAGNPVASITNGSFTNTYVVYQALVSLPQIAIAQAPATLIEIPVYVDGLTGFTVNGYGFELNFDPQVIVPSFPYYSTIGTLSETQGWTVMTNDSLPGKIVVGALGEQGLTGNGTLIKLIFSIVSSDGLSPLFFSYFLFNDGFPGAFLIPGSFENHYVAPPLIVSMPAIKVSELPGTIVEIPVFAGDLSGLGVISYEFTITFDGSILIPEPPYFSVSGTLSQITDWFVLGNETGDNELTIGAFGATALEGSGALIILTFTVMTPEGFSSLNFQAFQFNDGNPQVATVNGSFHNEPAAMIPDSLAVDNIIIGDGGQACYEAILNISISNFTVEAGGSALFFAGNRISFLAGTRVLSNGYMHASIKNERTYCSQMPVHLNTSEMWQKEEMIEIVNDPPNPFRLYPNPSNGMIIMEFNGIEEVSFFQVEVYSIFGERILRRDIITHSKPDIDLTGRPSGVYLIRVSNQGRYWAEKIILK